MLILAAVVHVLVAATPPVTLARTERLELKSAAGLPYVLSVSLPRSYGTGTKRYPIVLTLDAEYAFAVVRNVAEHLSDRDGLPELIVVGVGYPLGIEGDGWLRRYRVQRTRDYTPTHSDDGYPDGVQDSSGAADAFLDFLAKEALPFLEKRYRVNGDRTLVGHSYGGLLGAYTALTRPTLFTRAVLISPSLWYDQRLLLREKARWPVRTPTRLFLGVGALEVSRARDLVSDAREFAAWQQVPVAVFPDENHDSVFPGAVTRGLRVVFREEPAPDAGQ